jgi:hypothetical protein
VKDQLDQAIDAVAAQLTSVPHDDGLADRIVRSLPERRRGFWWLLGPAVATIAVLVVGFAIVLRTFDDRSTGVPRTERTSSPSQAPSVVASAASELSPNRTPVVERPQNRRRTVVEPERALADHERSLPAIEAVAALSVDSLVPVAMPAEAPMVIEPLAIADLALDPVQR